MLEFFRLQQMTALNRRLFFDTFENFQIQVFDESSLRLADLGVMIEAGCSVDFDYPPDFRWLVDIAVDHQINATEAESHVFGQANSRVFEQ